ncbi:DUF1488 family protein [Bradyrhizobium diazoefficiens]|nr:DUF1488 family protein [Bradyrhizobium diazoefficiens]UCF53901.1 MAG: DUF1488 family protein [Bradyrhizobium sp.]MBR0967959.1 DUF1488 family protein [Bradyrhizobium diazoefficiens]MBR0981356.1 DUF1488 family protein [Bradyrhizobium diazoefficiens]MBR1010810.1 DUF1488 family protein [Bradyrhizobium diazoefficiens]MBR1018215.1 DUF1488 family protein [Bradyrhizobium diazoefficiens]
MIVQLSTRDGTKQIACTISTSAMDDLERGTHISPSECEAQFTRLRERIKACVERKCRATEFEGTPPGIVMRSIDFGGQEPERS